MIFFTFYFPYDRFGFKGGERVRENPGQQMEVVNICRRIMEVLHYSVAWGNIYCENNYNYQ